MNNLSTTGSYGSPFDPYSLIFLQNGNYSSDIEDSSYHDNPSISIEKDEFSDSFSSEITMEGLCGEFSLTEGFSSGDISDEVSNLFPRDDLLLIDSALTNSDKLFLSIIREVLYKSMDIEECQSISANKEMQVLYNESLKKYPSHLFAFAESSVPAIISSIWQKSRDYLTDLCNESRNKGLVDSELKMQQMADEMNKNNIHSRVFTQQQVRLLHTLASRNIS
ncbi:MAG TPA: hypothetical protein VGP47_05790 [Parachlamydiaceae bacterium]|nr:hypothetical protein [Parachlamydiaceae bacterium]